MAKYTIQHDSQPELIITMVKKRPDDPYSRTWITCINGQIVGVGEFQIQADDLAQELAVKLTYQELVDMAEHARQRDLICPHCGHEGGAHWQGKCQHRVYPETRRDPGFCHCPGWILNAASH